MWEWVGSNLGFLYSVPCTVLLLTCLFIALQSILLGVNLENFLNLLNLDGFD